MVQEQVFRLLSSYFPISQFNDLKYFHLFPVWDYLLSHSSLILQHFALPILPVHKEILIPSYICIFKVNIQILTSTLEWPLLALRPCFADCTLWRHNDDVHVWLFDFPKAKGEAKLKQIEILAMYKNQSQTLLSPNSE